MKIVKRIILVILTLVIVFLGFLGLKGYNMYLEVVSKTDISKRIEEIRQDENYAKLDTLPSTYLDAVVSVEDRRFYNHGAIDIISIGRAVVTNIKERELVEGGSTITQQISKNIFFSQKQEFTRKIAEIFMAYDLEKRYSKNDILELYVNTSYFGDGYYGIREASLGYFHKEPKDMTLDECTLIAGIPNAPSVYAPTKNPDLARKRQKHVIKAMLEEGKLTQEEADSIL